MSLPNIPNITPVVSLTKDETIRLILASIAAQEISFANILNAQSQKLEMFLQRGDASLDDMLKLNRSLERIMRNVIKNEMLLLFKLEDALEVLDTSSSNPSDPHGSSPGDPSGGPSGDPSGDDEDEDEDE